MGDQFKVGDRVRVVRLWSPAGYTIGDTGVITRLESDIGAWVKWDYGSGGKRLESYLSIRGGEIELAPTEPERKFKVGDKVRVARKIESGANGWENSWPSSMDRAVGKTAVIIRDLGEMGLTLKFDEASMYCGYSYPAEALELVTAPKAEQLLEALRQAKAKTKTASERESRAEEELKAARWALREAEHAEDAVRTAIYEAA